MEKLILTEKRNKNTINIDIESTQKIVELINDEDLKVALAVQKELEFISKAVDLISSNFLKGGNLLYFGAGTSGRLGVLDASECPPTFGVDSSVVRGYIAGGDYALRNAVEGSEDDFDAGISDFKTSKAESNDVIVAISASGNPQYLLGVLQSAKEKNIKTISITCNKEAKIKEFSDVFIAVEVGPEALTGSSRMKAGTAQKMILNMLTTASMIKIGKTYENYMIDVQPTNIKLKDRAARIVSELACVDYKTAKSTLESCHYKVKESILALTKNISFKEAEKILSQNKGKLRSALNLN